MKAPFVDPVGLTRHAASSRKLPLAARLAAFIFALVFGATVVVTSVLSIGDYCLTSDGGNTRHLPRR